MKVIVIILVRFYINVTIFVALLSACNLGEDEPRAIRGHTAIVENIAHGAPMLKPDRYCKDCHGVYQPGGEQGQPSCFQCHGQYWDIADPGESYAPASHNNNFGGYLHNAGYEDPESNCVSCHGVNLQGTGSDGTPGCFLCHGNIWVR